jgi:WD40 repeat protein
MLARSLARWRSLGFAAGLLFSIDIARADGPEVPAKGKEPLPGLISTPRLLPGGCRWQMVTGGASLGAGCVDFSPDGKRLAIGTGQIVRIIDAPPASNDLRAILVGHRGQVRAVRFAPDGKSIATASLDGTVRIWNADGQPQLVYDDHDDMVFDVAWAPDGKRLASADMGGSVRIWTTAGETTQVLSHPGAVNSVSWNPNGQLLATACDDKTVRFWNSDGKPVVIRDGHVGPARAVAWSPDGKRLLSCDHGIDASDNRFQDVSDMKIWDIEGNLIHSYRLDIPLSHCCWTWDGTRAIAGGTRTALIWDPAAESEPIRVPAYFTSTPVATQPHGDLIVAGLLQVTADQKARSLLPVRNLELDAVRLSPDGTILGVGRSDRTFYLFSDDGELVHRSPPLPGGSWLYSISWSPDGSWFVPGQRYSRVLQRYDPAGNPAGDPLQLPGDMRSVDWSNDGNLIATGGDDRIISLVNLTTEKVMSLGNQAHGITNVRFTPDQTQVCSTGYDGCIRFWSLDGKSLKTLEAPKAPIRGLAWADDELMITGHEDGTVRFWNPGANNEVQRVFRAHGDYVEALAVNADGAQFVSGSRDNSARIWNRDGTLQSTLFGHSGAIMAVDWPAGGDRVITCADDGTVRIWDLSTGRTERLILIGERGGYVTLDAEGRVLFGDEKLLDDDFLFAAEDADGRLAITDWAAIRAGLRDAASE